MTKKSIEEDAIFIAPKTTIQYTNIILALAIAFLSYGAIYLMHPFHIGISDTILLLCFITIVVIYTWMNYPLSLRHYKLCVCIFACCIPNLLFANYLLKFFNFLFIFVLIGWFLVDATHKQIAEDVRRYILLNLFHALCIHPFLAFRTAMTSLFESFCHGIRGKHMVHILLGTLLSIPVLFIVLPLLIAADASFQNLVLSLFIHMDDVVTHIVMFILSIPIFCYLYPLIYAHVACERKAMVTWDGEKIDEVTKKIKCLPSSVPMTMELILTGVYILFLVLTCMELSKSFSLSLVSFSYSAFARRGFFELCIIALLNILLIGVVHAFTKEDVTRSFSIVQVLLCSVTILIIFTAMGKMALYVYAYGLTPLRVYSSWFMVVLLGMFLILLYHIHSKKQFLIYHFVIYFCLCFFVLNMLNVPYFVAFYNEHVTSMVMQLP